MKKRHILETCFAAACLAAVWPASAETAENTVTVRRSGNGRLWQTVIDAAEPIVWRWDDDARSAVLSVADRTASSEVEYTVGRSGDDRRGSAALEVPEDLADGVEHLYDLTLRQYSEAGKETSVFSARVALLPPSAGSGSVLCGVSDSRHWSRVRSSPRLFAYDAEWSGGAAMSPDAWFSALSATARIDRTLPGSAGYDTVDPSLAAALTGRPLADVTVMTGFGENGTPFASETLRIGVGGLLLYVH
jgi:hypothetical protein